MSVIHAPGPKAHIVAPDDAYFGTTKWMRDVFGTWGIEPRLVDMTDLAAVETAMRPTTRLVWMETPSNPLLRVTDIAAVAAIAKHHGARSAVDNTWATPVLQRPLDLGADVVMHSTTKYLGGHSDVLGGALVVPDSQLGGRLGFLPNAPGPVAGPLDAWLSLGRGRTLAPRLAGHCQDALRRAIILPRH